MPWQTAGRSKSALDNRALAREIPYLSEKSSVQNVTIAKSLVHELDALIVSAEAIGALVAVAHLDAAIQALCREFDLRREGSKSD